MQKELSRSFLILKQNATMCFSKYKLSVFFEKPWNQPESFGKDQKKWNLNSVTILIGSNKFICVIWFFYYVW